MSHSYTSSFFHFVFSTKERRQTIHVDFRQRLWAYMGGIARENGMKALCLCAARVRGMLMLTQAISLRNREYVMLVVALFRSTRDNCS